MRARRHLPPIVLAILVALPALSAAGAAHASSPPNAREPANAPLVLAHRPGQRHHDRGATRAPSITRQPTSESVTAGAQASFRASAGGSPEPTVRWERSGNHGHSWSPIGGARAGTLAFSAQLAENGYEYRAIFANSAGSTTTRAARLTVTSPPPMVNPPPPATPPASSTQPSTETTSPGSTSTPSTSIPSVTSEPSSVSADSGANVSFSSAATGDPSPTVQWQVSSDGGNTWNNVAGATSNTYAFTASGSANGYEYRAVFTNSAGSATSAAATLTVTSSGPDAPQVTLQPSDQTVADGDGASFTAAASGSPAPTVQWQVSMDGGESWSDVEDATSDTYSFTADASQNADEYRAVFTNTVTSATTDAAVLTVAGQSYNWAGYDAYGATFTSVSGSWTVPTLNCGSQSAYSAQWIGIDGAVSDSVEQDGTEAECIHGHAEYYAWYEMYGDTQDDSEYYDENQLSGCAGKASCSISPDDAMSASVSVSGSAWTLSIDDTTAGWTFSTTIDSPTPVPAQSSAEWIVERPDVVGSSGYPPLADFGSTTFTGASASAGGASEPISAFSYAPLEMISDSPSATLSTPGPLSPGGSSFTATWLAAGP